MIITVSYIVQSKCKLNLQWWKSIIIFTALLVWFPRDLAISYIMQAWKALQCWNVIFLLCNPSILSEFVSIIREYGSTLYVGMAQKTKWLHFNCKWWAEISANIDLLHTYVLITSVFMTTNTFWMAEDCH